jgi:hypothetical protein
MPHGGDKEKEMPKVCDTIDGKYVFRKGRVFLVRKSTRKGDVELGQYASFADAMFERNAKTSNKEQG